MSYAAVADSHRGTRCGNMQRTFFFFAREDGVPGGMGPASASVRGPRREE
jgi:hypothetical protein